MNQPVTTLSKYLFTVPVLKRYAMFIMVTFLCYFLTALTLGFILRGGLTTGRVAMSTMTQDILAFIAPAIITAMLISRKPADFLCLRRLPLARQIIMALVAFALVTPAMNIVIDWNAHIHLPQSMAHWEQWMRQQESAASETIYALVGNHTIAGLILTFLTVGLLAGTSEEIFFRGGIQRLLITTPINPHVAVWVTAVLFSAAHMQFFGFVPRMLLGALFGYVALWTGSTWTATILHSINNTIVAASMWYKKGNVDAVSIDHIGIDSPYLAIMCLAAGVMLLWLLNRTSYRK